MAQIWKKLGISASGERVYKSLLKLGMSTIGAVVNDARLQKSTVYYSLMGLERSGFVKSSIRNNIKHYESEHPKILLEKAKLSEEELKNEVSSLESIRKESENTVKSSIYEGFKAVVSSLHHRLSVLNKGDDILIFGSLSGNPESPAALIAIEQVNAKAIRKGIKIRVLFNEGLQDSSLSKMYRKISSIHLKYIKEKVPVGIALYKDFIYTLVWDSKNPVAVITQSEAISKHYKSFFEYLWNRN